MCPELRNVAVTNFGFDLGMICVWRQIFVRHRDVDDLVFVSSSFFRFSKKTETQFQN